MTRLSILSFAAFALVAAGPLAGQTYTNSNAASRYAPAGPAQQNGQPVVQQPGRPYGPQPMGQQQPAGYPVRPVNDQRPVRPPQSPVVGGPPAQPVMPVEPAWVSQMSPGEKEWVDKVLAYWETKSDKIKTFECKFQRWDYDPIFGPKDKPKTFAEGAIKYAAPDKGLFRVEKLSSYVAPGKPGEKENYIEQDASFGEHWVCDGIKVFEFDARNRKLIERTLPPEMRGRAIADGPLPFLFGAKAETIKARYWVRSLPETGNGKYWLEAVPKSRQDAQNFKLVHIVLDEKDYLPERLVVFAPNYDPQRNPARQSYVFTDRVTTDENKLRAAIAKGLNPLGLFQNNFFEPKLPAGWQKIVQNDSPGGTAPPALEATRPMQPQPPRSPFSR